MHEIHVRFSNDAEGDGGNGGGVLTRIPMAFHDPTLYPRTLE